MPGIPVGYLTPAAVFLGALTVFVMEGRRYRRHGVEAFKAEGRQIVEAGRKSSEVPEASGAAFASRKMD